MNIHNLDILIGDDSQILTWWQMSVRGLIIFAYGLALIRVFGRRAFGKQTPLDIVVAIIIGSNLSRALTGNAAFVPTIVATGVVVLSFWLLARAAVAFRMVERVIKGDPLPLGCGGRLDARAMLRAGVSSRDIEEAARRSGIAKLEQVGEVTLETSGKISIVSTRSGRYPTAG